MADEVILSSGTSTIKCNGWYSFVTNSWVDTSGSDSTAQFDANPTEAAYFRFPAQNNTIAFFTFNVEALGTGLSAALYDDDPFTSEPIAEYIGPSGGSYSFSNFSRIFATKIAPNKVFYLKIWTNNYYAGKARFPNITFHHVNTTKSVTYPNEIVLIFLNQEYIDGRLDHDLKNVSITITGPNSETLEYDGYDNVPIFRYSDYLDWFAVLSGTYGRVTATIQGIDGFEASGSIEFSVSVDSSYISPSIESVSLANVADSRMPSNYGYVAGYSKVKISASVNWGVASEDSVTVTYGGNSITLTYNISTGYYEGTTTDPINGATTFYVRAEDVKDRYATSSASVTSSQITVLSALSMTLSTSTLKIGETITVSPQNFVGKYSYSFRANDKLLASDTQKTASSFTETATQAWFTTAQITTTSMSVTIKIIDQLGREYSRVITVTIPTLSISLNKNTVTIGDTITVTLNERAGRTVTLNFTTTKNSTKISLYSVSATSDEKTVTCPRSWFTDHSQLNSNNSINVQVTAVCGSTQVTRDFELKYPSLEVNVRETSVTAGESFYISATNREDETLTVNMSGNSYNLASVSCSSDNKTITTNINYFDKAKETQGISITVTVTVTDKRNRSASDTFVLTANASTMKPVINQVQCSIVQPSPASENYPNTYIANVSKVKVSVSVTLPTSAKVSTATLYYSGVQLTLSYNSSTGKYEATTRNPITGNTEFRVTVTDERQYSSEKTQSVTGVKAYNPPVITVVSYHRCNQDHVASDIGEYCELIVNYTISSIDDTNEATAAITSTVYNNSRALTAYTQQITYFFAVSIEHSYDITITLTDKITSENKTIRLSTAGVIMDFLAGGKGIGLGKVAEHSQMVEVNSDWEFKACVRVNGELVDLGTVLANILGRL